ncbi:putative pentatricopeptide repeat-containing protein At2g02150 [Asparagus officinalis]|uniref:putative pentatricopeptide repeat-containing protein At2g02150 n=1 Tax=Asparagus officinalis TaxID=4686 RepID=UPI00098DE963|nr:putative pentatricopeptide repeat-containing protein At2g02150 [Asparagus officinalis]
MESLMEEYRHVDGIKIAPSGRMSVSLFRSGETIDGHVRTQMEELWTIEEVDFNIQGLTMECFLPPASLQEGKKRMNYMHNSKNKSGYKNVSMNVIYTTCFQSTKKECKRNSEASKRFFDDIMRSNMSPTEFTFNIMIDFLCKEVDLETTRECGELEEAERLLGEMKMVDCKHDVIIYTALINCLCKCRKVPKSLGYLNEMRRNDIRPNVVNFSTFIDAFCKEGMMNEAMKFFVDMRIRGLTPNEFTYTSLIDGNCKADNLKEALIAG